MTDNHYIYTNKYRLNIRESWEDRNMQMVLTSKVDNSKLVHFVGSVPAEWMEGDDEDKTRRKLKRYRQLHVDSSIPPKICLAKQEVRLMLKDETLDGAPRPKYSKKQAEEVDTITNKHVKYWRKLGEQEIKVVLDSRNSCIHLSLLERTPVKAVEALITPASFPDQQISLTDLFEALQQLELRCSSDELILGHELLHSVPAQVAVPSEEELQEKRPGRIHLFKHVFLTEVITHMITHQFGRIKYKHTKHREGYSQEEYIDEELEGLRSWGYRMYQFRDHPIKWKKKKRKEGDEEELDSLDEEEEEEAEEYNDEQEKVREQKEEGEQKEGEEEEGKKEKKMTRIQEMGRKIKRVMYKQKSKDICNFIFTSGYQKSRINKMRYCLHQLAMETDHTQAMMDFIRLVFKVVPIQILKGKNGNQDSEKRKEGLMSEFLERFKVKRCISSCFFEYIKDNFFHKILNTGLRLFRNPYQLIYLRLPFYHVFWSIKLIYHRHKRAIFQHKQAKNKDRIIRMFRGSSINKKEVEQLEINVGTHIEAEGFLSTSLDKNKSLKFISTLQMIIHVPVRNLKSRVDNGFAYISYFLPGEEEVLFNAFNVFKVLSFKRAGEDQMAHVLELQYGSMKTVEEQVRKSEDVLDKEFLWKQGQREILFIRHKLNVNEENMTKHWHSKLTNRLEEEQKKHQGRKERLDAQTKKEYEHAVEQLSQWDKELLLNTQHQLSQISASQNYGDLLRGVNEFRKACIYLRRRIKQVQAMKAIEGMHWRNNHSLIQKLFRYTMTLYQCYAIIGRVKDSWGHQQQLMKIFKSIRLKKDRPNYYGLLFHMCYICNDMVDTKEQAQKYKEELIHILEKYSLADSIEYKLVKQQENRDKQRKKVAERKKAEEERKKSGKKESKAQKKQRKQQQQKRKQQLTSMKKKLKNIRLYTYGLHSRNYLSYLCNIIEMLDIWEQWRSVIKQGYRYMQIRYHTPQVQYRKHTCYVLKTMLDYCVRVRKKSEFQVLCKHLASYIPHNIHNYLDYQVVLVCVEYCLIMQCWRVGRQPLLKLMQSNIKCKVKEIHAHYMMLSGYVLLLLSMSSVEKFLQWITGLYQQQSFTHTWQYNHLLQHVKQYNNNYNSSQKNMYAERKKEYYDANMIKYVHKFLKKRSQKWSAQPWEETRGELIGWQHPFHQLHVNLKYSAFGIEEYMGRGQVGMLIQHCLQLKNQSYNVIDEANSKRHLSQVCVISKLHKNEHDFTALPQLLEFCSDTRQLQEVQVQMGIDVEKCVSNTQHLREDWKQQMIHTIRQIRKIRMTDLKMDRDEVKWMRAVGRRCKYYRACIAIKRSNRNMQKSKINRKGHQLL